MLRSAGGGRNREFSGFGVHAHAFAEPHRDQRAVEAVLKWDPEGEVGRERERTYDLRANEPVHDSATFRSPPRNITWAWGLLDGGLPSWDIAQRLPEVYILLNLLFRGKVLKAGSQFSHLHRGLAHPRKTVE